MKVISNENIKKLSHKVKDECEKGLEKFKDPILHEIESEILKLKPDYEKQKYQKGNLLLCLYQEIVNSKNKLSEFPAGYLIFLPILTIILITMVSWFFSGMLLLVVSLFIDGGISNSTYANIASGISIFISISYILSPKDTVITSKYENLQNRYECEKGYMDRAISSLDETIKNLENKNKLNFEQNNCLEMLAKIPSSKEIIVLLSEMLTLEEMTSFFEENNKTVNLNVVLETYAILANRYIAQEKAKSFQ